jgi:hypothetical protein
VVRLLLVGAVAMVSAAAQAADLSVGWISRLPKIDYVWKSKRPAVVGWPKNGQKVTWVAHVRNLTSDTLADVGYRWILNGKVVASGLAAFEPDGLQTFTLPQAWKRTRQELVFEIDPAGAIAESEERNNRLLVHTDALAVGLWVEESFWLGLRDVVTRAGFGAASFDDWVQQRIRQFNEMAALAVYPETPKGVLDRWRIDAIHVVPDGALPVSPVGPEVRVDDVPEEYYSWAFPDSKDRSIDMEWGFPASALPLYRDREVWQLLYDSLVHELGHARYLTDVYSWDVSTPDDVVALDPPPPSVGGRLWFAPEHGLMNASWGYIDRYSAIALNRIAGHRATQGHYNSPANGGSFLNDLPAKNVIRLVTRDGQVFPGATVNLYRASGDLDPDWLQHPYRLAIDGLVDQVLTADGNGAIQLGRNPFAPGPVVKGSLRNNALVILEMLDGETRRWGFLDSRLLNLAFWRGQKKLARHEVVLDEPVCFGPGVGPTDVSPPPGALLGGANVNFRWTVAAEQLWIAVDGGTAAPLDLAAGSRQISLPIAGSRVVWWLVYRNAGADPGCPALRSGIYWVDLAG